MPEISKVVLASNKFARACRNNKGDTEKINLARQELNASRVEQAIEFAFAQPLGLGQIHRAELSSLLMNGGRP